MQRKVLNYLYNQGELTFFAFPGEESDYEALEKFALAMNAGARFVLFDFTGKRDSDTGITLATLFQKHLSEEELAILNDKSRQGFTFGGVASDIDSEEDFRKFYYNLQLIKKSIPHTVALLPGDEPKIANMHVFDIARAVIIAGTDVKAASIYVEDSPVLQKTPID